MIRRLLTASAALLFLAVVPVLTAAPARAGTAPYVDPAASGKITLCDVTGHMVTQGNIHTKPFVWRAVSSEAAPPPWNGAGRTAALYGYQPIQQVDPSLWNGEFLTASGRYTNADHPMAPATAADPTLADYLYDYPTKWDGLVELRMFLGAPGAPIRTTTYPTATIQVTGNTWTLVDGGNTPCDSGTASSSENVLPAVRALGTPLPNATTTGPAARATSGSRTTPPSSTRAASSTAAGVSSSSASTTSSAQAASARAHHAGSNAWPWVILGVAVAALGVGLAWLRARTRVGARSGRP